MFAYWLETAVVASYSVLKVVVVGGPFTLLWMPLHLAMFGVFMAFHLTMILMFGPHANGAGLFPSEIIEELFERTWVAAVGLVISHGISFVVNFMWNGEYRNTTVDAQVAAPWKRLIVMHVTTLLGAWSVMLFEAPVGARGARRVEDRRRPARTSSPGALLWLFALWKSRRSSGLRSSWVKSG